MADINTKIKFDYGNSIIRTLPSSTKLANHFTLGELANNSAKDTVKMEITNRSMKFLQMIEEFRVWFNKPMTVNSNFRTVAFNKSCGGDAKSRHLYGEALDWGVSGHTAKQRTDIANKWKELCTKYGEIGAINFYTHGYHFEIGSNLSYGAKAFSIRDYRGKKGDW